MSKSSNKSWAQEVLLMLLVTLIDSSTKDVFLLPRRWGGIAQ
ncbi:MAG: hypothetical protein U1F05_06425 [Burkholderiales bacterium]